MNSFTLVFITYSILLIVYLFGLIYPERNGLRIKGILIVRLMYMFIYAIVPLVTIFYVSKYGVDSKTLYLDLSIDGLWQICLFGIWGFIGYIGLELGYRVTVRSGLTKREHVSKHYYKDGLWKASLLMNIIAIFALFLWTYPFGGPIKMFEYGSVIRSGREVAGISNTFGFMKQLVPLSKFASVICLGLILNEKKIKYFINFVIALIVSLIYSIANDGRAPFLMFVLSLMLLFYIVRNRRKKAGKIKLIPIILMTIIGYIFITNIYAFIGLFTGDSSGFSINSSNVGRFVYDEFSWTVRNPQAVLVAHSEGDTFRIGSELLSGIISWFPSRFRPEWLPRLEKVNTEYWYAGSRVRGGKPPDIITTGIYTLSFLGVFLLPFLYGIIVKAIDRIFENRTDSIYYDILFVQLVYQFAKTVAYCDFALVALNLFYLIIGHFIVVFFNNHCKKELGC